MGRTVPTFREEIEDEMDRWREFRKALRKDDREAFDEMMEACKRYSSAGSQAKASSPFQAMVLSILLGQEKRLSRLEEEIGEIRKLLKGD
ncbi:hypothetical protein AKJ44_01080 [candidate division MSBL1 archaeon SCGC-AAA261F17]|uniref:DUF8156 domain-containing protein n=1 Tax=candidate division MSBL1 archaeon SCGC-AAA261F17 TaxID=1698274 RepID=A0A133V6X6_9EURY|nr:hypothetical protein AKJ44_01080 [candidate division MSBL1 archaeon SCGC-AAA261F17]